MESVLKTVGSWLFLIGIVIAVIVGLIVGANWYDDSNAYIAAILGILGFIVGVFSFFAVGTITKENIPTFLIAALILVGIGTASSTWSFGQWEHLAPYFRNITQYLFFFAAPAAGILAIRAIWDAGKSEEIEKVLPKIPKH